MREFVKSSVRYVSIGWFWVVALVVLPNCKFDPQLRSPNLNAGHEPRSSVILCDIEDSRFPRQCSTREERTGATRLAAAAVALNEGIRGTHIGLDDSPEALARCSGEPEVVVFRGPFPQGYPVCVNCGDVVGPGASADAACVLQCEDFYGQTLDDGTIVPNNPPKDEDRAFCEDHAHARASTNFPQDGCFPDACTTAGLLKADFVDPRQEYEPVIWTDTKGVLLTGAGNSLIRDKGFTGMFDAGADSSQVIASGDGFVEFTATETNTTRLCGLSSGAPPDPDVSANIGFAIDLFNNNGVGEIIIFQSGLRVQNFSPYNAGDRFRVHVTDNHNNTATISYSKITGPCNPGSTCADSVFYTSLVTGTYPFRVDSSFFDVNATLTDVRLVRIH